MKRTDFKHHALPVIPFPRWCFDAWCLAAGDAYADEDVHPSRLVLTWARLRMKLFGWWWWV